MECVDILSILSSVDELIRSERGLLAVPMT
jgi:hypothetical protein